MGDLLPAIGSFFAHLVAPSNPLWYYWPLVVVIGAVYKTTQFDDPGRIVRSTIHFVISMSLLMLVLSLVLLVMSRVFVG